MVISTLLHGNLGDWWPGGSSDGDFPFRIRHSVELYAADGESLRYYELFSDRKGDRSDSSGLDNNYASVDIFHGLSTPYIQEVDDPGSKRRAVRAI
jgi:hypothetical protein